ncbi:MAG: hypothetical protein JO058_24445 [Alphaproteobacteria bacterium]|nr:hypothetical protein [Alphaproteobacteria bacterium]
MGSGDAVCCICRESAAKFCGPVPWAEKKARVSADFVSLPSGVRGKFAAKFPLQIAAKLALLRLHWSCSPPIGARRRAELSQPPGQIPSEQGIFCNLTGNFGPKGKELSSCRSAALACPFDNMCFSVLNLQEQT